jgi:Protein N-terminal asparagine amidohydrolase
MVLFLPDLDGQQIQAADNIDSDGAGLLAQVLDCQALQASASSFAAAPDVDLEGQEGLDTLQVLQQEHAVIVAPSSPTTKSTFPHSIGSDAATTCIIVGVRDPASRVTALGHLDNPLHARRHVQQLLQALNMTVTQHNASAAAGATLQSQAPLCAYLVGGMITGDGSCGRKLAVEILQALHCASAHVELALACIGPLNVVTAAADASIASAPGAAAMPQTSSRPAKCSLAISAATGEARSVRFTGSARGPAFTLRSARLYTSCTDLLDMYDPFTGLITVQPFAPPLPALHAQWLRALPDAQLLQYTSTSPEAEDERFCDDTREKLDMLSVSEEEWWSHVFPGRRAVVLPARERGKESTGLMLDPCVTCLTRRTGL